MTDKNYKNENLTVRPPIVAVMGHIDHGKSSILDYIRKTNVVGGESGGITQHLSAYEVAHKDRTGAERRITFLDTPGHEAFSSMRERGAHVADVVILVVSAEDGVKAQTLEAFQKIKASETPMIVAINKIDKPAANVEKTKNNLIENEIYLEGYGGNIPFVPISAKTGDGIPELLDMIILVADMEELNGAEENPASGFVIESNVDKKRGISATLIITNGTLEKGMFVAAEDTLSPIRNIDDFAGKKIDKASFSSPVRIIGFDKIPPTGAKFVSFKTKREAEAYAEKRKSVAGQNKDIDEATDKKIIPLIIKSDFLGTLEAVIKEVSKIEREKIGIKIIQKGVGEISENDAKIASSKGEAVIIGFGVGVSKEALGIAEKTGIVIKTFDIIYKITDFLNEELAKRTPKETVEETTGQAKILKTFSKSKDKQVLGGKIIDGVISVNSNVKILRREYEIGRGRIVELQQQKIKAKEIKDGEFGMMIESKIEIAPGDTIDAFSLVTR